MSTIQVRNLSDVKGAALVRLLDRHPESDPTVMGVCQQVIEQVRGGGDDAVLVCTSKFDGVELSVDRIRVSGAELDSAEDSLSGEVCDAIRHAIRNIERYHELQCQTAERWLEVQKGVWCADRWTAIDSVCLYVPRGRGAFASVACMLGVPARLAQVPRVVVCTPPNPDGSVDSATLFACRELEIDEIYRVGGAQAVAAVAIGTETIPRCEKIVGPGNVYVTAARQLLSHTIDPGSPAGPSESLILCDDSPDAANVAWNLLIEAEHGENSTALLVTHSRRMADAVVSCLSSQIELLTPVRRVFADAVLQDRGGVLLTASLEESVEFANRFAAEHIALMVEDPWSVHPRLTNAGEIIFGNFPVISLANYAMGLNAILPTGGRARSASPISVLDFLKVTSLGFCTPEGFAALRPTVSAMSRNEGFCAHHLAVENWKPDHAAEGDEL